MKLTGGLIRSFLFRWGPVLLWVALIFVLSANPDPYRVLPHDWEDKCLEVQLNTLCQDEMLGRMAHVLTYAILAGLFSRAISWGRALRSAHLAQAFGLSSARALLDEIHQSFVPGRTFQLSDLGLDVAGMLLGILLYWLMRRHRRN